MISMTRTQTQITLHRLVGWFTRRLWMETRSFTFHFAVFQTDFSGVDHGGFVSLPLVLQSILINRSLSGWQIDAAASICSQELRRNVTRLASLLLFAALCICWSLSDEAVIGDQRVTGYISVTSDDPTNPAGRHVRKCARLPILSQARGDEEQNNASVHLRGISSPQYDGEGKLICSVMRHLDHIRGNMSKTL